MKFQPDSLPGTNVVTRQAPGEVWVGASAWRQSLLIPWRGEVRTWPASGPDDLTEDHFAQVLALSPEVVIFGSGEQMRFVRPALYRALIDRRIGVETMTTAAACRTYNVLVSEGRSAVAALLLAQPAN